MPLHPTQSDTEYVKSAVAFLREEGADVEADVIERLCGAGVIQETGESCGRLLVGRGDDTYDPLCVLSRGHSGRCEPEADELGSLAEHAGIDTSVCEFCGDPLDDSEPWRRGMDGCGAHESCLKGWL